MVYKKYNIDEGSNTMLYLVIVESQTKCVKIKKYLNDAADMVGSGVAFDVAATIGHITELKSLEQIAPDWTPMPQLIAAKRKNTEELRKKVRIADAVWIACDNDREGEAIAYSVCQEFKLPVATTRRIVFNEITETAIRRALAAPPSTLSMPLVRAAQARQVLDLLVGFRISPVLWKCIGYNKKSPLSAGRCQTPALRLVYDNDVEIRRKRQEPKLVHVLTAEFTSESLPFSLSSSLEEAAVEAFLEDTASFDHMLAKPVEERVSRRAPPEPLTTCTMQQMASNRFGMSPKEAMSICQTLYERGYITYMRTDMATYSAEFVAAVSHYVQRKWGNAYVGDRGRGSGSVGVQAGAHEGIRPTDVAVSELPATGTSFTARDRQLYRAIWEVAVESCMAPASYQCVTATLTSANVNAVWKYTAEMPSFLGWQAVAPPRDGGATGQREVTALRALPPAPTALAPPKRVVARPTVPDIGQHYTEARLVQLLKELGIGRPATYASLVDKIQERGYVEKREHIEGIRVRCIEYTLTDDVIEAVEEKRVFGAEHRKLVLTPTGFVVSEFLYSHFEPLFAYEYTSTMEADLDRIVGEELSHSAMCAAVSTHIDALLGQLPPKLEKKAWKLDDTHEVILGSHGPVIRVTVVGEGGAETTTFLPVRADFDIRAMKAGEYTSLGSVVSAASETKKTVEAHCAGQWEGENVYVRRGRFGLYAAWKDQTRSLAKFGNRPAENITLDEILPLLLKPPGRRPPFPRRKRA